MKIRISWGESHVHCRSAVVEVTEEQRQELQGVEERSQIAAVLGSDPFEDEDEDIREVEEFAEIDEV